MATKVILGKTIKELGLKEIVPQHTAVKEAVFPFSKFPELISLGPQMKSTGKLGIDKDFGLAYIKSLTAGQHISKGCVFLSVREQDKPHIANIAKALICLGFDLVATRGTQAILKKKNCKTY